MKEKILAIVEHMEGERWDQMEGYAIHTDKQVIKLLIDNDQQCCEDFGYFMSDDDFKEYIGAEITDITLADEALNTARYEQHLEYGLDMGDVVFVNIHTTKGLLQFTAYNEHNGYYGHGVKIESEQLKHKDIL